MENLSNWADELNLRVYQKWKTYLEHYNFLQPGFATFYSPVINRPKILILGLNPGGTINDFNESEILKIPEKHDYLNESYQMAKKMVNLLGEELVMDSVKSNLVFFRSRSWKDWMNADKDMVLELNKFCFEIVKEMIHQLNPQYILLEGFKTEEIFLNMYNTNRKNVLEKEFYNSNKKCLISVTELNGKKNFSIPHPTGARGFISQDWEIIKSKLRESFS